MLIGPLAHGAVLRRLGAPTLLYREFVDLSRGDFELLLRGLFYEIAAPAARNDGKGIL